MIRRYVLHLEFHLGYRPRVSLRRAPRPGDEVVEMGVTGVLVPCTTCSTQGLLFQPDEGPDLPYGPCPAGGR